MNQSFLFVLLFFASTAYGFNKAEKRLPLNVTQDTVPEVVYQRVLSCCISHDDATIEQREAAIDQKSWLRYLEWELGPAVEQAVDKGLPEGCYSVEVRFVIDRIGNITEVKIMSDPGFGLAERIRIIFKKGPRWTPAVRNGKRELSSHKQLLTFLVADHEIQPEVERPHNLNHSSKPQKYGQPSAPVNPAVWKTYLVNTHHKPVLTPDPNKHDTIVAAPVSPLDSIYCGPVKTDARQPENWAKYLGDSWIAVQEKLSAQGFRPGIYPVEFFFLVDKDGSVSFARTDMECNAQIKTAVEQVLLRSPKWEPATQNGRVVRAYKRQTVLLVVPGKKDCGEQHTFL